MIEPSAMFPVFVTNGLASLRDFYASHFGFEAVFFDEDFYLHLLHPTSGTQLGFLMPGLASQPEFLHPPASTQGMVISFEVSDAEAAFNSAHEAGLDFAMPLKTETWGQKHFMVEDPQGLVIDIVEHLNQ